MPKIVLEDTNGGYNITSINRNFQKIQNELNDKVLYRLNNVPGQPNEWRTDMDANGKRLYNLPAPISENEAARLKDVLNAISGLPSASQVPFTPYGSISATTVQGAIQQVQDEIDMLIATPPVMSYIDYTALRASTGTQPEIYITGVYGGSFAGIAGKFIRDLDDTTSVDNGGTIIVRLDGVRYKREPSDRYDIMWFGAYPSSVFNSAPAIQAAINAAKLAVKSIWVPAVTGIGFRIDQGIKIPERFMGIDGENMYYSAFYYTGTGTAISPLGDMLSLGCYRNFSVYSGLPGDSVAAQRAVGRCGIQWRCYGGGGEITNVKAAGFNGFGQTFEAIWDSVVTNNIVENCGGQNFYAWSVVNGTDTANHTVFNRIQSEVSYGLAVYFEGLNNTLISLHTERTIGDPFSYSHVFKGDITIIDARIEEDSNIKVLVGIATGSMQNVKCFATNTYFEWGARIPSPARMIDCEFGNVIIPSSNLRQYDFFGGSMSTLTSAYAEKQTTLTGVSISGGITLIGSGVRVNMYDGTVAGNIIASGGGVNTVEVHDSELTFYPTVQNVLVYNSTIANTHTTPTGQKARSYNSVFAAEVVVQGNSTKWQTQGCEYKNGATKGPGTPGWSFGKGDWVSSGIVDPLLLVPPTGSSAAFANGEYCSRIMKTVGQPQGWYCTTAGSAPTLAFTSEGNM